jgi:hypothetical protein
MPAQSYQYLTFAQARAELASRLDDSASVYWLNTSPPGTYNELSLYLWEALRTFNSLVGYFRGRGTFNGTSATPFYDLTSVLSPALRTYTLSDTQSCASLQYSLIENGGAPAPGNAWVGTDQFNLADLTNALQLRRDQFLEATGAVLTASQELISPNQPRYGFSADNVIDVRRMAWIDGISGQKKTLWRQDEWQSSAYTPGWAAGSGSPQTYSLAATPQLNFSLNPVPVARGTIELITVNAGLPLNPAQGVLLGVPDDWAWVVQWGALATLLSIDGPAFDPRRAAFCEQKWQFGLKMARLAPAVLACNINGKDRIPTFLADLDLYTPNWENVSATATNTPNQLACAGLNLVALSPVPATTLNPGSLAAVVVDVVQNTPVPVNDTDYLPIGREELEGVFAYAHHLASFKVGGRDFEATEGDYTKFLNQCAVVMDRTAAYTPSLEHMRLQMHRECEQITRRKSDAQPQGNVPRETVRSR